MKVLILLLLSSNAFAAMGVFGNNSYTSSAETTRNGIHERSYSSSSSSSDWVGKMAVGGAISQIISVDRPDQKSKVEDTNPQLNLSLGVEHEVYDRLSVESGVTLGLQIVASGNFNASNSSTESGSSASTSSKSFTARYLNIPMQARLKVSTPFSIAAGGIVIIPTDSLEGVAADKKLTTTDLGFTASARWMIPAGRNADWTIDAFVESGQVNIGDGGLVPNHVRNFGATFGMAARF